jgi:putative MATE family efflux protein
MRKAWGIVFLAGAGVEAYLPQHRHHEPIVARSSRQTNRAPRLAAKVGTASEVWSPADEELALAPALPEIGHLSTNDVSACGEASTASDLLNEATRHIEVPDFSGVLECDDTNVVSNERSSSRSAKIMHDLKTMTLPLLAVWLSNPLLSLIDTAAVGKVSSVLDLASLGPATAVCDLGTYVFSFLSVVTTGLIANAVSRGNEQASDRFVNDAIVASTVCGVLMSAALLSPCGVPILRAFLGGNTMTRASRLLIPGANTYARIRALGFIPCLIGNQLQAAALARRNVRLPLMTVAVAGLVNLFGDYLLVVKSGMGIAGAAWATLASQVVALGVLVQAERSRRADRLADDRTIAERSRDVRKFFGKCMSPCAALVGRAGIGLTMARAGASCGTVAVAANQILYSVFALFCPMGEAISQTVMNLLPAAMAEDGEEGKRLGSSGRSLISAMLGMAVVLGGVDALAASALPMFAPTLFTSSRAVATALRQTAPWMGLTLVTHALSSTLEGVLFATGDARFLGTMYPMNMVAITVLCTALKPMMSLKLVWFLYAGSVALRFSEFSARTLLNQRSDATSDEVAAATAVGDVLSTAKAQVRTAEGLEVLDSLLQLAAFASSGSSLTVPDIPRTPHHGRVHYLHYERPSHNDDDGSGGDDSHAMTEQPLGLGILVPNQ